MKLPKLKIRRLDALVWLLSIIIVVGLLYLAGIRELKFASLRPETQLAGTVYTSGDNVIIRVIDGDTGQPIEGAVVTARYIDRDSNGYIGFGYTGPNGEVYFK